ncbi:unnamed protein product, partial [Lepidochelys olivacea]
WFQQCYNMCHLRTLCLCTPCIGKSSSAALKSPKATSAPARTSAKRFVGTAAPLVRC